MSGLLAAIRNAPADHVFFADKNRLYTAGAIRATAWWLAQTLADGKPVFLHTQNAALFVCGLAAAALKRAEVFCPAHIQPEYLREIGVSNGVLVTDGRPDGCEYQPLELQSGDHAVDGLGDQLVMHFFTSGSTSAPKLVRKTISQLDCEGGKLGALWNRGAEPVYATVSHHHIYGMLFRIFWPVLSGRISQAYAAATWEELSGKCEDGATIVTSPAHLTRIPDGLAVRPGLIFSSGAPLPSIAAQDAHDKFGVLPLEVLGSTETGGIAWRQQDTPSSLWTPFTGVRVECDEAGGLVVRSDVAGSEAVQTGDCAEICGEQFRITGRSGRIVKIDGFRVSLPRVEEHLLSHPFAVAVAAVDLPQRRGALGAIVELSSEGLQELASIGPFRLSRKLREHLAGHLDPRERPKHWLFAPIPVDRQGKRVLGVLRAKFQPQSEDRLGELLAISIDGNRAELSLRLHAALAWFQGHFPGQPILPGIAQTHMAVQWAECLWGFEPSSAAVSQLKFRRILPPGSDVRLTLIRDDAQGRLSFAYTLNGIVASEGRIGGA